MTRLLLSGLLALFITLLIFRLMSGMVSIKHSPNENSPFPAATIETMPKTLMEVQTIEVRECDDETIAKAKEDMQQYRSCKVSEQCVHTGYGFLDGIAINRVNRRFTDPIINELRRICGPRQSHDDFYSKAGIEIRCPEQTGQCDVFELPVKPKPRPKTLDFSK
jgi:hypothetical protein